MFHTALAYGSDADLVDHFQTTERGIERCRIWGAAGGATNAGRELHRTDLKIKRTRVRKPAYVARHEPFVRVGTHIQKASTWTTAQPLQGATNDGGGAQGLHINGDDTDRLIDVEKHKRAYAMRLFNNGGNILNVPRTEDNVRNGHDQCAFVNRVAQCLRIDGNAIAGLDDVKSGAALGLRLPGIMNRRKFQV